MQLGLTSLFAFLDQSSCQTFVLATVIETHGASYRKAGAMMLIDEHNQFSGLVSGGCLEDDLIAHAGDVFESGCAKIIEYDLSLEESASLWGLGLGCGGTIRVLLERVSSRNQWGGLASVRPFWNSGQECYLGKVVEHHNPLKIGQFEVWPADQYLASTVNDSSARIATTDSPQKNPQKAVIRTQEKTKQVVIPVSPAQRLLICGAGPDAIPLARLAAHQYWQVTVADHRPAYLTHENFQHADRLLEIQPDELDRHLSIRPDAAVIMTHNVERDAEYLVQTVRADIPYVGLLGPVARRDQLLERAGIAAESRIHGPAGLDLGAVLPEEIALSIMAQIQAFTNHRSGQFLSTLIKSDGS